MAQNNLSALFRKGGVYYNVPGKYPKDALASLVGFIPGIPNKAKLLTAILEREDLMPTAMGNGIALPHPRSPLIEKEDDAFAALAFPQNDIDWGALDGKPVHTIILVVSSSAKTHLASLQKITFFCRAEEFCAFLKRRAPAEEILDYIEKTEQGWN